MITAHKESLADCLEEIKGLLAGHHEELALNKDRVKLEPDYDQYLKKEDEGVLFFVTLRSRGEMVGYYIGFIVSALHNKSCMDCHTDIYYVHPSIRGDGGGDILFDFCESELSRRGVVRWFTVSKNHKPATAFLERKGHKPIETVHCKVLG